MSGMNVSVLVRLCDASPPCCPHAVGAAASLALGRRPVRPSGRRAVASSRLLSAGARAMAHGLAPLTLVLVWAGGKLALPAFLVIVAQATAAAAVRHRAGARWCAAPTAATAAVLPRGGCGLGAEVGRLLRVRGGIEGQIGKVERGGGAQ